MDFKHQISGLDHNELTIVAWDPPGYGLSRPPAKDFKPGFYIRDAHLAYGLMKVTFYVARFHLVIKFK